MISISSLYLQNKPAEVGMLLSIMFHKSLYSPEQAGIFPVSSEHLYVFESLSVAIVEKGKTYLIFGEIWITILNF